MENQSVRPKSVVVEYIWIDGSSPTQKLRSKTRVFWGRDAEIIKADQSALGQMQWSFDGSSTGQADGSKSDCILAPVMLSPDPLRDEDSYIALCEVFSINDKNEQVPHTSNMRAKLREIDEKYKDKKAMFGIEQEYTMFKHNRPLGFPDLNYQPHKQGPYYCGVGIDEVFGSEIAEEHMQVCREASIRLSGINSEVMPGQWEFQVGPLPPLLVADQIWMARWFLYKIAAKYDVAVKLDPKPVSGDWNGAGAHTNFSTEEMRAEGGYEKCVEICERLSKRREEHLKEYGDGIEERLTGRHETCSYKEYKYGVGDRTASVRIPLHVKLNGKGYIEDRRPNSNMDPYKVVAVMMETACNPEFQNPEPEITI